MVWHRWFTDVDDPRAMVRMRRLSVFVLVAGLVACAGESGSAPADPSFVPPPTTAPGAATTAATTGAGVGPATTVDLDGRPDAVEAPDPAAVPTSAVPSSTSTSVRRPLPGFGEVAVQVRTANGDVLTWCLLLAETEAQAQRGLMEVTDPALGGYDGMLFRFDDDHGPGGFYMRNTPQELSIAYLDEGGALVSTATMAPCDDVDGCPTYDAAAPYRSTVEAPTAAGGVERLGISRGSVVTDTRATCTT